MTQPPPPHVSFLRLFVPGLVGVLSLYPVLRELVVAALARPELSGRLPAGVPPDVLAALSLVQPALLLAGATVLGLTLALRVGLHSVLAGRSPRGLTRTDLRAGVLAGTLSAGLLLALDALTRPLLGAAGDRLRLSQPRGLSDTLGGVLYGGITEELLLRWGVMTLLVWAGWRLWPRGGGRPGPAVMWGALTVSALLFGAGHLGAAGALTPLTTAVVLRTVGLNAVVGLVFGWLYWRRNLETAMIAHATWHVVVTVLSVLA